MGSFKKLTVLKILKGLNWKWKDFSKKPAKTKKKAKKTARSLGCV